MSLKQVLAAAFGAPSRCPEECC